MVEIVPTLMHLSFASLVIPLYLAIISPFSSFKKKKKKTHTHTQGREHDSSYHKFKEELVQIVAAGPDMVS